MNNYPIIELSSQKGDTQSFYIVLMATATPIALRIRTPRKRTTAAFSMRIDSTTIVKILHGEYGEVVNGDPTIGHSSICQPYMPKNANERRREKYDKAVHQWRILEWNITLRWREIVLKEESTSTRWDCIVNNRLWLVDYHTQKGFSPSTMPSPIRPTRTTSDSHFFDLEPTTTEHYYSPTTTASIIYAIVLFSSLTEHSKQHRRIVDNCWLYMNGINARINSTNQCPMNQWLPSMSSFIAKTNEIIESYFNGSMSCEKWTMGMFPNVIVLIIHTIVLSDRLEKSKWYCLISKQHCANNSQSKWTQNIEASCSKAAVFISVRP